VPNATNDHGPFETEHQALATPAVRAVYRAYDAGTTSLRDGAADLLLSASEEAGVVLGAYDRRIFIWLAQFKPQAAAAVAGIVIRAAVQSPREVAFDLGDDYAITYFCLSESLQAWGARQREQAIEEGGNKQREEWSDRAAQTLAAVEAAFDGDRR
jgi:hypothetical protein